MQFSTVTLFAFASSVISAADTFGLLAIRSGSGVQYYAAQSTDGTNLDVSSAQNGHNFEWKDHSLYDSTADKYVDVSDDKLVLSSTPGSGFSDEDGHLAYNNATAFFYSSEGEKLAITGDNNNQIVLRIQELSSPSSSASSAAPSVAPATGAGAKVAAPVLGGLLGLAALI